MVEYKLFSPCGRSVALVFKEGTCILEKRVDIIVAKIELLVREFTSGKFLDGSMGKKLSRRWSPDIKHW